MIANIANMTSTPLGKEIRRLRLLAGFTQRGLAADLGISAAHLSDIELSYRSPSESLLRKIATKLRKVGVTYTSLENLISGIDSKTREWAASTPGARVLFRKLRESGQDPREIHRDLERLIGPKARNGRQRPR
jgi:transcriptional regulator with XRE-family HTH domain